MNFRRYYVPNAIVFITQVVHMREPIFTNQTHLKLLLDILHNVKELHPFSMTAYVFMPDHFHLMIKPTGASDFSKIMQSLKSNFTYQYKHLLKVNGSMKFWQKRFHDHVIRDLDDFENHLHYIHYNPIAHGYVTRPEDWPQSSFLAWKEKDVYSDRWGWSLPESLKSFNTDYLE